MNYDAIIFDLDGTLWDSSENLADSWNEALCSEGVEHRFSAEDIAGIMGRTGKEIEELCFAQFAEQGHDLYMKCIEAEPPYLTVHGGKIYEGVEAMLRTLSASFPLFIVSNCQNGYIEAFLSYSKYGPYFKDYEYFARKGLSKAENIRLIMERHGIEKAVYVGDTAHDEKSAKCAGCDFIHAGYGFGSCCEPLAVIKAPMELCTLLALS